MNCLCGFADYEHGLDLEDAGGKVPCKLFVEQVPGRRGGNYLSTEKRNAVVEKLQFGVSIRDIVEQTGVSKHTIINIRKRVTLPPCQCGKPGGHRGWCKPRVKRSHKRRAFLTKLHTKQRQAKTNWVARPKSKYYSKKRLENWKEYLVQAGFCDEDHRKAGLVILAALFHNTHDVLILSDTTAVDMWDTCTVVERLQNHNMWRNGYWSFDTNIDMPEKNFVVWLCLWAGVGSGVFYRDEEWLFGIIPPSKP